MKNVSSVRASVVFIQKSVSRVRLILFTKCDLDKGTLTYVSCGENVIRNYLILGSYRLNNEI